MKQVLFAVSLFITLVALGVTGLVTSFVGSILIGPLTILLTG